MPENRRKNGRRKFIINKNYIVQFICVVITCITIIVSTNIVIDLQDQLEIQQNINSNSEVIKQVSLTHEDKMQINELISFLESNINTGDKIDDKYVQYCLTGKYINYINNTIINVLDNDSYIDSINPETYRELGYVYFDDYKDNYKYVSKDNFVKYYSMLFNEDNLNLDTYKNYYISSIDAYVLNNYLDYNDNVVYRVGDIHLDTQTNKFIANNYELNLLKIYSEIDYELVNEFLKNTSIDSKYYSGTILKINLILKNNKYVFDSYCL